MKINVRLIMAALFTASTLMVAACNTIEGVGRDVESAGGALEDAAQKR